MLEVDLKMGMKRTVESLSPILAYLPTLVSSTPRPSGNSTETGSHDVLSDAYTTQRF